MNSPDSASPSPRQRCGRSSSTPASILHQAGPRRRGRCSCVPKGRGLLPATSSPSTRSCCVATTCCSSSKSTVAACISPASPPTRPVPRPTRTRQHGSRRIPARPTDPTTPQLRRTHQPVPPSSLNHPDNGQPVANASASTCPLLHHTPRNEPATCPSRARTRFRHLRVRAISRPGRGETCGARTMRHPALAGSLRLGGLLPMVDQGSRHCSPSAVYEVVDSARPS